MTVAAADPDPGTTTFADVLRRLGNVPAGRVLVHPYPATEADVVRLVNGEPRRLVELVDGYLVEKAMGYREDLLGMWIGTLLNNFVVPRRLGVVGGAAAMMRFRPGMVRMPDAHFKSRETLPTPDAHDRPVARFAPDLAVEVLSRSNTRREMERKRQEYFAAGTRLVWIVDPRALTVAVFTDPDTHTLLTAADTLDGGDVLPGFRLPVADIFAYLDTLDPPPAG